MISAKKTITQKNLNKHGFQSIFTCRKYSSYQIHRQNSFTCI